MRQRLDRLAAAFGQPGRDRVIARGGGRRTKLHRVGKHCAQHGAGQRHCERRAGLPVELGDQRAGRPNRLTVDREWLKSLQAAEIMMIDDRNNLALGDAGRGLIGMIVVGQNDLAVGLFGQVPAQQHAMQHAIIVDHRQPG